MCRTGNLKTGKSQNHKFSGNKSPGKYTRYTVIEKLKVKFFKKKTEKQKSEKFEIANNRKT